MPRASRRSRAPVAGATLERTPSSRRRRRRRRWLRLCRLLARQKWRGIGVMGVVTIFLAALLLCLTAYFEQWGQAFTTGSSLDSSAPAPQTEDPSYFEDKDIPKVFTDYAVLHNSATASPMNAKYVVYEMPGNTTVAQSLFGLTSTYLFALMSERVLLVQWTGSDDSQGSNDIAAGNSTAAGDSSGTSGSTSSLEEIFLDPGFFWSWERFEDRWLNYFGYAEEDLGSTVVDVIANYNSLVCDNLKNFMGDTQFIKITNTEYFAPLLTVNQHAGRTVLEEIPSVDTFASLSNWLMRPVPTVTAAVRRFRERYFEDNYVIVMEMDVLADTTGGSGMSAAQQQLFFKEASDASYRAKGNLTPDQQGVVVLVVTDDEEGLQSRVADLGQDSLGAAGVVAITGPRGFGTTRILTELQQAWLLGYGDVSIVSPASPIGVLGHARMSVSPIVIVDSHTAHQSTSSQPCLADVGRVQEARCFSSAMLSRLSYDPNVPCLGDPPRTVKSSNEARDRARNRRLEL
ncbi:unnamed protein product [Ectocarpus sp. CCAP 1310/34]|nr:unnamed protein product [Ectocarpus sp. CCAP 1310/34]